MLTVNNRRLTKMTEKSGLLPENPRKIAILTDNQINNKHDDG